VIYAAVTAFIFPGSFEKDGKAVPSYAFPFYIIGTIFLFIGMLVCAIVLERSSEEYYFKPNKPSKIFWLQPGKQNVGDQVFNAFMAVKEGSKSTMTTKMEYIKSIRVRRYDGRHVEIYLTLLSTLLGFIFQFIGLRGLHASVILAQLGSTFVMSILRTCLRTERMPQDENKMRDERDLTSHKQQELDCFAFYLKDIESFEVIAPSPPETSSTESSSEVHQPNASLASQLIVTRARLAELTTSPSHGLMVGWDNMPIRKMAQNLALVIESTMDLMSSWGVGFGKPFKFQLKIECQPSLTESNSPVRAGHLIFARRCGDALRWSIDKNQLEAILGLWVWSLYKSDEGWNQPLNRMVGLTKEEAGKEETYRLFHKWIFRQTEARLVSSNMIDPSRRLFGFDSDEHSPHDRILIMRTENRIETMAAQDIYINFLRTAFDNCYELGGETGIYLGLHSLFLVQNSRIDEMMHCFERSGLGSREDALLCIIPVLKKQNLLPELSADCKNVRRQVENLIQQNDWKGAFDLVRWICHRTEGLEFERSAYELGYLCRRALLDTSKAAQDEGSKNVCRMLDSDPRTDFFEAQRLTPPAEWSRSPQYRHWWAMLAEQVGWVALHLSIDEKGMKNMQLDLKIRGVKETLPTQPGMGQSTGAAEIGIRAIQDWLTLNPFDFEHEHSGDEDVMGYKWARTAGYYGLLYFTLVRWVELRADFPNLVQHAYTVAAKSNCDWGIKVLLRHGMDIDTFNERNICALMEVIALGNLEAARTLLNNGANPDGDEQIPDSRPLILAAHQGATDIVRLLLDYNAELEIEDRMGLTALHWASRENRIETVQFLLSRGAEVEKTGIDEATPLYSAVSRGALQMTQLLLDGNANINARDRDFGQTALMLAAKYSHVDILRVLLDRGAEVHLRDDEGISALDWARRNHRDDIVAILEAVIEGDNQE
jgi:ankyrin repeat protein